MLAVTLVPRHTLRAQDADIIRGQVLGPDKKPIENATVMATSLTNQTSRTAKTNKDGRFSIIFNGGGGDYMMSYTTIGFQPTRFEVKREVDEDILIADATMSKSAVALEAVRINAGRERPGRDGNQLDVGGRDQVLNNNNVPIDVLGDLSAMAATLPGVTLIPGADGGANGISVLGLGADQNNITLNGLNFRAPICRATPRRRRASRPRASIHRAADSPARRSRSARVAEATTKFDRSIRPSTRRRCNIRTPSDANSASNSPICNSAATRPGRFSSINRSIRSRGRSAGGRAIFKICSTPIPSRWNASA